jgi:hypothetical protein
MSQSVTEIIKETTDNDWGLFIDIELQLEPKKQKYNRLKSITIQEQTIRSNNESLMFKMDEDYENDSKYEDDNHKTNKATSVCLCANACGVIAIVLCCIIIL